MASVEKERVGRGHEQAGEMYLTMAKCISEEIFELLNEFIYNTKKLNRLWAQTKKVRCLGPCHFIFHTHTHIQKQNGHNIIDSPPATTREEDDVQ